MFSQNGPRSRCPGPLRTVNCYPARDGDHITVTVTFGKYDFGTFKVATFSQIMIDLTLNFTFRNPDSS